MTAAPQKLHPERPTIDHADIRWRVGQISKKDAHKGSLLGYIDARTCMEALDQLDSNWAAVHGDPIVIGDVLVGVPCALTVNGVTRSDVGMPSSQEPIKGAYSDALKRAAVHFGIGRELYELPRIYVKLDDYKKPVAIPTYRNGRWTLPSGAGSVFYDREPEDQPEQRGGSPSSPRAAPAQPHGELRDAVAAAAVEHGISHAGLSLIADAVGVPKGQRANADQLRAILERIEQPAAGVPSSPAGGGAEEARTAAPPDTPQPENVPSDAATAAAGGDSPPSSAAPAPTIEDVLAVTGGELVPPKPGTPEYKALPNGAERAQAKAYWDAQEKGGPQQETLAEQFGAPNND
jgi:hypothetical protein